MLGIKTNKTATYVPAMIEVHLVDENSAYCLRYPSIPNYPVTVWVKFIRIVDNQLPKGLVYVFRTV